MEKRLFYEAVRHDAVHELGSQVETGLRVESIFATKQDPLHRTATVPVAYQTRV